MIKPKVFYRENRESEWIMKEFDSFVETAKFLQLCVKNNWEARFDRESSNDDTHTAF